MRASRLEINRFKIDLLLTHSIRALRIARWEDLSECFHLHNDIHHGYINIPWSNFFCYASVRVLCVRDPPLSTYSLYHFVTHCIYRLTCAGRLPAA